MDAFLSVLQFTYSAVTTVDEDVYKVSVESENEIEKGSNKMVLTFPNSEPKSYSSNWYFNFDEFKTKGNTTFVIVENRQNNSICGDCASP
jgi:ABC-type molybdate transport system substrate-binding protein